MRGAMVETVKEGGSKAPGFSRDLCEIPAMPRVKKKTALRCANLHLYSCRPPRPSFIPAVPSPFVAASRRLEMEMTGAHRSAVGISRFQRHFPRDGKKDGYIRATDPDRLAPSRSDLPGHGN